MPPKQNNNIHTVSVQTLAKLFSMTEARVQQLANEKIIPRASHGKYHLWESITRYVVFLRKDGIGMKNKDVAEASAYVRDPDSPRSRREAALARKAEIETAQMEGNTIELGAAISVFCDHVANARTILLTLPGRVPAAARVATKLAVHEVLEEISQNKKALEAELVAADSRDVGTSA